MFIFARTEARKSGWKKKKKVKMKRKRKISKDV
jgi:hypothetical protein